MIPIQCNNCAKKRDVDNATGFQLMRCYHILCSSCRPKPSTEIKCPVCKLVTNGIPITRDMPSNIASYFQDPSTFLKMYRSISKFQSEQRTFRYKQFYEQQRGLEEKKRKLQGYIKLEAQLRQQIDDEKKRIEDLRNYISQKDQRVSSFGINDLALTTRKKSRPRTPSFSATETTITDKGNGQRDNCLKDLKRKLNQELGITTTKKLNIVPKPKNPTKDFNFYINKL